VHRLPIARYYTSTINPLKSHDLINHTRFAPLHVTVLHVTVLCMC
jgi:hypothetical protein